MLATSVCVSFEVRHDTFTREVATVASSRSLAFSVREKAKPRVRHFRFPRQIVADRITQRCSAARLALAVSHARAPFDSPTHSTRQPPCPTSTGVRLTLRRPRLSNHRPARHRARRRGTPRDACRRRQLRFSRAFEVRVAGRGGRRGSLLASPRVPLTAVPPLRAAPHPALPKPQTTRSSRSPTSPPRPRRRRRSRPIPASRTKTRRSRRRRSPP